VTQARQGGFYARVGVPDTREGRFELVVLHLVIVLHRLARAGELGRRLQRALTEAFVVDVDDTLREMTVGDLAVPRHVKRAVAILQDRYAAYGPGLAAPQERALKEALETRLLPLRGAGRLDPRLVCRYARQAARGLDLQPDTALLEGGIVWPQVAESRWGLRAGAG
jgi:cytochrome b pre-mRNA-processing protein 3